MNTGGQVDWTKKIFLPRTLRLIWMLISLSLKRPTYILEIIVVLIQWHFEEEHQDIDKYSQLIEDDHFQKRYYEWRKRSINTEVPYHDIAYYHHGRHNLSLLFSNQVDSIRIWERKREKHTGSWFKAKVLCVRYAQVIPKAPAPKSIPFFQTLWWAPLDWKRSWTNFLENEVVEWCV